LTCDIQNFSYRDGYPGHLRFYPGQNRGAVLYLHGIQSHGQWFEQSAADLADLGFAVALPDRRGSGLNAQARGDVSDYTRWISDQIDVLRWLKEKTGQAKIHILGVSWGGKLALALAKAVPADLAGLTLIAPGLFPAVDVPLTLKLQIALAVIFKQKKLFPIPLNDPEFFTDNPDRREFIRRDPVKLTAVTGNFLYQSRRLDRFIRTLPRLTFPAKLFLAGRERIIDNQATLGYYRSLRTTKTKQLAFYQEASHTLEFEENNRTFIHDLQEWCQYVAEH
jgi:alpha-beta hydrolase superfamily lysophospholipase